LDTSQIAKIQISKIKNEILEKSNLLRIEVYFKTFEKKATFLVNPDKNLMIELDLQTDTIASSYPKPTKILAQSTNWHFSFSNSNDSISFLNDISVTLNLKLSKKDKITNVEIKSKTIFLDKSNFPSVVGFLGIENSASKPEMTNDRKTIEKIAYNPKFWEENYIYKRTQEEDSLISLIQKTKSIKSWKE
jgi:hypothetical protein